MQPDRDYVVLMTDLGPDHQTPRQYSTLDFERCARGILWTS